jgi:hypothetical protein
MKASAIRHAAGLTVIACLGLMCPRFASAAASAPSSTADAIASGVITNAHGQVDGSGQVYVFASPDQSKLIGAPAGKPIALTLVGYARTNAKGQYAVTARSVASLMAANGRHGYLNLQVVAVSGGTTAEADYSVAPAGAAWRAEGGTNSVPSLSFNFATRLATLPSVAAAADTTAAALSRIPITPSAPSAAFEQLMKSTGFASAGPPPPPPASPDTLAAPHCICPTCTKTPEAFHTDLPEHFVNLYTISTGNKIPETVTEAVDKSTTHTLGIGVQGKNKEGKVIWTGTGTGSITDEVQNADSSTWATSRTMYNLVNYRDYKYSCPHTHIQREPYNFWGLLPRIPGGPAPMRWFFNCEAKGPHDNKFSTTTAKSATIGFGMSIGPINVSAQSGYSTSVQLVYIFHVNGEVCGNSPFGPEQSSIVEADQASP